MRAWAGTRRQPGSGDRHRVHGDADSATEAIVGKAFVTSPSTVLRPLPLSRSIANRAVVTESGQVRIAAAQVSGPSRVAPSS